jgi:hypothetical protein
MTNRTGVHSYVSFGRYAFRFFIFVVLIPLVVTWLIFCPPIHLTQDFPLALLTFDGLLGVAIAMIFQASAKALDQIQENRIAIIAKLSQEGHDRLARTITGPISSPTLALTIVMAALIFFSGSLGISAMIRPDSEHFVFLCEASFWLASSSFGLLVYDVISLLEPAKGKVIP